MPAVHPHAKPQYHNNLNDHHRNSHTVSHHLIAVQPPLSSSASASRASLLRPSCSCLLLLLACALLAVLISLLLILLSSSSSSPSLSRIVLNPARVDLAFTRRHGLPAALDYLHPNHSCVVHSAHRNHTACPLPATDPSLVRRMDIALTVCGEGEVREMAATHLKSWLIHAAPAVDYHFFVLTDAVAALSAHMSSLFALWPVQPSVRYLDVTALPRALQELLNDFKRCATARVFLPLLLPAETELVLYLDIDTLIVSDPRSLWSVFQLYGPQHLLSFAWETQHEELSRNWYIAESIRRNASWGFPVVQPWGLNSGVMLLNVSRVRRWSWSGRNYTEAMLAVLQRYRGKFLLGDQDWYNAFVASTLQDGLDVCLPLSERFNWRSMSAAGSPLLSGPQPIVVLHGNDYHFTSKKRDNFSLSAYHMYKYWDRWPSVLP